MPKEKTTVKSVSKKVKDTPSLGGPFASSFELTKERRAQLTKLYRAMRLTRDTDDRMRKLFRAGRYYGTYFSQIGQECTTVVPAFLSKKDDFIGPSHRELGCLVGKGVPIKHMFAQVYTRSTSQDRGVMHPVFWGWTDARQITPCTCLATQAPLAAGAALSYKMRGLKNVAFCFTGEGAASKGDFHETLNFAGVHKLPLIYVVQNNWYAESVPLSIQSGNPDIESRAAGYGIAGVRVHDGNDRHVLPRGAVQTLGLREVQRLAEEVPAIPVRQQLQHGLRRAPAALDDALLLLRRGLLCAGAVQEVVASLVDPVPAELEPPLDRAERAHRIERAQTGFLGHLTPRRLLGSLPAFDVPLGESPVSVPVQDEQESNAGFGAAKHDAAGTGLPPGLPRPSH